jgi:hypothetical protein
MSKFCPRICVDNNFCSCSVFLDLLSSMCSLGFLIWL